MRKVLLSVGIGLLPAIVTATQPPSETATAYLNAALSVLQQHFLHRDKIDWPTLRHATFAQAAGAENPVDTYPAIRFALAKLEDHHSYLQLTPELARLEDSRRPRLADPSAMPKDPPRKPSFPYPSPFRSRRVPEGAMVVGSTRRIAQVVVPQFASQSQEEIDAYATSIQRLIGELMAKGSCGYILDLRGNGGGNIWAMMAGVGPLLGDSEPGALLHDDGSRQNWFYEAGKAGLRGDSKASYYAKTTGSAVRFAVLPPVAVLVDRETGSSGEGIAIAFQKRSDTRFFGELTFGAATSTFPYALSDGATIYLVTGVMLDRAGNEYVGGVAPDIEIPSETTISTIDPVIHAATEWLAGLRACAVDTTPSLTSKAPDHKRLLRFSHEHVDLATRGAGGSG